MKIFYSFIIIEMSSLGNTCYTGTLYADQIGSSQDPVENMYVLNKSVQTLSVCDKIEFENEIEILQPNDNRIKIGKLDPVYATPADSIVMGNNGRVGESSVSIGSNGGCDGERNVAVGFNSGELSATSENNVSLGAYAGGGLNPYQMDAQNCVFIGNEAEGNHVGALEKCVVIGNQANTEQSENVVIGSNASSVGTRGIAIGTNVSGGGTDSVCIGQDINDVSTRSVAVGSGAGNKNGGGLTEAVAIGYQAFSSVLGGNKSVSIGSRANAIGGQTVGTGAVCIGANAQSVGGQGVAVGEQALSWGLDEISIGENAGAGGTFGAGGISQINLGAFSGGESAAYAIHIGHLAGVSNTGEGCILVGEQTGNDGAGANTIAIGRKIGASAVLPANSIILSADNSVYNPTTSGFFVSQGSIRGVAHGIGVGVMKYDTTTGEITYSTT